MKNTEIANYLSRLMVAFPNIKQFTKEQLEIWIDALSDLSEVELSTAYKRCIQECEFFPSIAEIRKKSKPAGSLDNTQRTIDILDRIDFAVRRFGSWRSEEAKAHLGEHTWNIVQKYGGWQQVCSAENEDEWKWKRLDLKRSVELYLTRLGSHEQIALGKPNKEVLSIADKS